jgi:hypothetical protein
MSVAGFFLELLIPGAIGTFAIAAVIVLLTDQAISFDNIPTAHSYLLTALFLMNSYLLGILLRHFPLFERPTDFYAKRINAQWPKVARAIRSHLITHLKVIDDADESGLASPEIFSRFTAQQSAAFFTYLRDYVLSQASAAVCELFNYEWRFSRLARNCAPPLLGLSLALCLGADVKAYQQGYPAIANCALRALLAGALLGLVRVLESRWSKRARQSGDQAKKFVKHFFFWSTTLSFSSLLVACIAVTIMARTVCPVAAIYAGGASVAVVVLMLLRYAYQQRIYWQVDILMRMGSFMFLFESESPIEKPAAKIGK